MSDASLAELVERARGRSRGAARPWPALAALGLLLLPACALVRPEVGVLPIPGEEGFREITRCALDGPQLSSVTLELLALYGLSSLYDRDPEQALRALHRQALADPERPLLFALAEASWAAGKRLQQQRCYLSAAVYAYLYLLGDETPERPSPYDRRFRWACDLYNQGLQHGLARPGQTLVLPEGRLPLVVGSLNVRQDRSGLQEADGTYGSFLLADRFRIRGLGLRLRDSGLGLPLIGVDEQGARGPDPALLLRTRVVPVTAFLRLQGGLADLEPGLDACLALHSGFQAGEAEIGGGRRVPLESDRSVALAYALNRSELWRFALLGLFDSEESVAENRVILTQPHRAGRVPVVFVHGTASSPAYWAELFNTLWWDPLLRERCEFWLFQYATGNPIVYSAASLRESLQRAVDTLDPEGEDPALRDMVLVGHSQGGLLAKLMVVDGSPDWFADMTDTPWEQLDLPPDQQALLLRCLDFDPLPFVRRVVFISTPHRGSFLARRWYASLFSALISLPREVSAFGRSLTSSQARLPVALRGKHLTSLDNMDPESPILLRLLRAPIAPGVHVHSIISVGAGTDPTDPEAVQRADDGVVEYTSAHLAQAESERTVPWGHSCQGHPATLQEMRRILLQHVAGAPLGRAPAPE